MKVALLFVVIALAGCVDSEVQQEPEQPETVAYDYAVTRSNYTEGATLFMGQLGVYAVDLEGTVYAPNATNPDLILIMHGRHGTCQALGAEQLVPLCPETPISQPVDSHLGYDAFGYELAKKGFFVVSVDANGVNDNDNTFGLLLDDFGATARVNVLQAHYDYLMANHDLSGRVGLIGHSRGGEAVNLAATLLQPTPSAIFSIAPTDFDDHDVEEVPFLVLLPECDGDVSDLQGMDVYRRGIDDAGPRYQVWMAGANHNFYNSVWYQNDAGYRYNDGLCVDESRVYTPEAQTKAGAVIASSFFNKEMAGEDDGELYPAFCHWQCDEGRPIHLLTNTVGTPTLLNCQSAGVSPRAAPEDMGDDCHFQPHGSELWSFSAARLEEPALFSLAGENMLPHLQFSDDPSHKAIFRTFLAQDGDLLFTDNVGVGDIQFTRHQDTNDYRE